MSARLDGVPEFVAVAAAGSFTAGAGRLGLSKSVVSERIRSLETRLGVRLLHRSTRRLSLTEAGAVFYDRCGKFLDDADAAVEAVQTLIGRPHGRLRICCTSDFAEEHLVPILAGFCHRHPGVTPDVIVTDDDVDLVGARIDVAIRFGTPPAGGQPVQPLAALRSILCAAPSYLQKRGRPAQPKHLATHDCLLLTSSSRGVDWRFQGPDNAQQSVTVAGRLWTDSRRVLRRTAIQGLGIATMSTILAGAALRNGELVRLLPDWRLEEEADRQLYVVFSEQQLIPEKARSFVEYLQTRIGAPHYWE